MWWVGIVPSFSKIILNKCICWGGPVLCQLFFDAMFLSVVFSLLDVFDFIKNYYIVSSLMNTCNMFLNTQKIIIGCLILQFFKGVPHQQDWSSIVCLVWWSSGVSKVFLKCFFSKSFSPFLFLSLLKLFSFYFLSSILLGISKCLISQNIVCLIKTPLKRKQHSHNFSRG